MWCTHNAEKVFQSDSCKILWDFSIHKDKKLKHNKPDITVIDTVNKSFLIIDPTCPIASFFFFFFFFLYIFI